MNYRIPFNDFSHVSEKKRTDTDLFFEVLEKNYGKLPDWLQDALQKFGKTKKRQVLRIINNHFPEIVSLVKVRKSHGGLSRAFVIKPGVIEEYINTGQIHKTFTSHMVRFTINSQTDKNGNVRKGSMKSRFITQLLKAEAESNAASLIMAIDTSKFAKSRILQRIGMLTTMITENFETPDNYQEEDRIIFENFRSLPAPIRNQVIVKLSEKLDKLL